MGSKVLWAVVCGFLAGILLRSIAELSWPFAAFFLACAALSAFFAFLGPRARGAFVICSVACACVAFGMLRMDGATVSGDTRLSPLLGSTVTIEGIVTAEPDVREGSVRLTVAADTLVSEKVRTAVRTKLLIVAPPHTAAAYGDRIEASGRLDAPEPFDTGAGHVFNYPLYLAKDGILYELSFAQVGRLGAGGAEPFTSFALGVKHLLLSGLYRAIPEPQASLAAGITLGDKRSVGEELSDAFVRASLIHIVVLSGYNITVVINATSAVLSYFPRIFRFSAGGLVVAFFILMTGGAATAVRAGLMAYLAVYARLTGRTFIALRALGATALLMVLWDPWTLAFDPSFQLSALATAGLILFTPVFEPRLHFVPARLGLREIIASTLATQSAVLPLLLYQSGNLSLVALPANLLALVAMPAAMGLSAVAMLAGLVLGPYAVFAGFPAAFVLGYIIKVAVFFAALPFASLQVPAFSGWLLGFIYLVLAGLLFVWKRKAAEH
jgi:competence protein ComEC